MKKFRNSACVLSLFILFGGVAASKAQDSTATATDTTQQSDDQKQKEKEALEKKAVALLEQIIVEVQMLKLPENRIRVQIAAGDLLWKHNESRARSMLSLAGDGVAELMRNTDGNTRRWSTQLRQELVLAAAQHDAPLAYQLLATTRPQLPNGETDDPRRTNLDLALEQNLLARVAELDPKFAAQKAEESLAKDQFPSTLAKVLSELQLKDKEAFAKLSEKVVSRLQTANMLSNFDAGALALSLLLPGPRVADKPSASAPTVITTGNRTSISVNPVLSPSAFADLMGVVIDAALRATPPSATQRGGNQRGAGNLRGRGPGGASGGEQPAPTDAQTEQNNARRLLSGLQGLLPQIDQYVPARATAVRQKLTEVGASNNPRAGFSQFNGLIQQGTADSILEAAPAAPPPIQSRLYQQAALKALDEGNADRARQIANEHLDQASRDFVLQRVDFQLIANKVEAGNLDQLRQALAQLRSDDERIDLLLQLANAAQKKDKKLALRLLSEAQRLTNRRATGYRQFDQQLSVAGAFASLEPARSFEVMDPGISQLNELLSAAALLSGFEVNVFKDGELPFEPNSSLTNMVARYGQQLASLAKLDFERAEAAANRFQLAEPRLMARLSIVRNVLGGTQTNLNNGFGGRPFGRRAQ